MSQEPNDWVMGGDDNSEDDDVDHVSGLQGHKRKRLRRGDHYLEDNWELAFHKLSGDHANEIMEKEDELALFRSIIAQLGQCFRGRQQCLADTIIHSNEMCKEVSWFRCTECYPVTKRTRVNVGKVVSHNVEPLVEKIRMTHDEIKEYINRIQVMEKAIMEKEQEISCACGDPSSDRDHSPGQCTLATTRVESGRPTQHLDAEDG